MVNKVYKVGNFLPPHFDSIASELRNKISLITSSECQWNDHPSTISDDTDMVIKELSTISLEGQDGWIIAALTGRQAAHYLMLVHGSKMDENKDFKLTDGATIGATSTLIAKQLTNERPDVTSVIDDQGHGWLLLKEGKLDGLIVNAYEANTYDTSAYKSIVLHVSECTPMAGQSTVAIMCRKDDVPLRKILLTLHSEDIAKHTNVERQIARQWKALGHEDIVVHCFTDQNSYHHVYAATIDNSNAIIRARISQSTTHGMAERIITTLNNHFNLQ